MLIYREHFDDVDTYKSYCRNVLVNGDVFIFPYMNIGLMTDHPLNKTGANRFMDRGHIVFSGAKMITDEQLLRDLDNHSDFLRSTNRKMEIIGGTYLGAGARFEVYLECTDAFLQVMPDSVISDERWIPIDTLKRKQNMDPAAVDDFFNPGNLPENLQVFLGNSFTIWRPDE